MANWYTVSYGLVTRDAVTSAQSEPPTTTTSDDPWVYASLLTPRPRVGDHFVGGVYQNDETPLSEAQGAKLAALRDLCADHIKNLGFISSMRLPDSDPEDDPVFYVFPSEAKDQANIVHAALVSLTSGDPDYRAELWCGIGATGTARVADATEWDIRRLSPQNIAEVAATLRAHVHDAQEELQIKTAEVFAATTVNAVNAIQWERPNS